MVYITMASCSSVITLTLFDDAPEKPDILRLTLKLSKSPQFASRPFTCESPRQMLDCAKTKVERGEQLTEEEVELINDTMEQQLTNLIREFKEEALSITKIKETDTIDEMKYKLFVQSQLLEWLSKLLAWVTSKVKEITSKMEESPEWCIEKSKELFEYLWSFFE